MRIFVIGAGLAGLSAALQASEQGHDVTVVSRGLGGTLLSTGTLDVYGRSDDGLPVGNPFQVIAELGEANRRHPYAAIGADATKAGIEWLQAAVPDLGYQAGDENVFVATAVGGVRPTLGLPATMAPGALTHGSRVVVAGLSHFKDFPAELIADNLNRSALVDVTARPVVLDVAARDDEADSTATTYAREIDATLDKRHQGTTPALLKALTSLRVDDDEVVLLPAVLGLSSDTIAELRQRSGMTIAEVPVPPPSVPGRRLNDALLQACKDHRVDVQTNAVAVGGDTDRGRISVLHVDRAGRTTTHRVDAIIYAGGGFESGTLHRDAAGVITERVFGLPVFSPDDRPDPELLDDEEILRCGVRVDQAMRPLDASDSVTIENLHCVGSIIGGALPWKEHSGEGIALGSAYAAVRALGQESRN